MTHSLHRDRFKLFNRRKTSGGDDKLKKSISSTSGIAGSSETSLLQSCTVPPNVAHSIRGGGAGRSCDQVKGLSQSNRELGTYEDGIFV